jgi:hypothetical protein
MFKLKYLYLSRPFLVFCYCLAIQAFDLTFTWSLPSGTTTQISTNSYLVSYPDVEGYILFQSATISNFVEIARFPSVTNSYTLANVGGGKHFFYLVSTNMWGVSSNSNIVGTPGNAPKTDELRIKK